MHNTLGSPENNKTLNLENIKLIQGHNLPYQKLIRVENLLWVSDPTDNLMAQKIVLSTTCKRNKKLAHFFTPGKLTKIVESWTNLKQKLGLFYQSHAW